MRIAVIGAGALGTLLGGLLADGPGGVSLVHHRRDYVDTINRGGVRIESEYVSDAPLEVDVPATTDAGEVGPVDLGVVVVRSYQTRDALDEHAACIGPDTRLLTFQNGLANHEVLADVVGARRTLVGVTYQGADLRSPGVVRHTNAGATKIGGGDPDFRRRLADRFAASRIGEVGLVDDPMATLWDKQLVSLAFKPLAALTRLSNGPMVRDEALVELAGHLIAEARAVAEARGIDIPTDDALETMVDVGERNPDHRSSMLQDVAAGRKTEIDEVNGAVADYAAEEGIATPYNTALTALVRGLERGYLDE